MKFLGLVFIGPMIVGVLVQAGCGWRDHNCSDAGGGAMFVAGVIGLLFLIASEARS